MNSQCLRLTKQQQPVLRLQKKRIKYKIFRCIFGLKSFDCFFIKTEAITHFHAEYFQFQSFSPFAIDFSFILWDYFGLRSKNGMLSVHDFIFQCLFSVFNIDGNLCLHALCILYEKFMWDVCNLYVISFGIDWQDDENISSKLTMNEKKTGNSTKTFSCFSSGKPKMDFGNVFVHEQLVYVFFWSLGYILHGNTSFVIYFIFWNKN